MRLANCITAVPPSAPDTAAPGPRSRAGPSRPGRRLSVPGKGLLYGNRALDRPRDRGEGRQEAVAHRLHLCPAVLLERLAGDALVLAQDLQPLLVPQASHDCGMTDDIG